MKISAFVAASLDGYVARPDGSVDWLGSAGDPKADMSGQEDMGLMRLSSLLIV